MIALKIHHVGEGTEEMKFQDAIVIEEVPKNSYYL